MQAAAQPGEHGVHARFGHADFFRILCFPFELTSILDSDRAPGRAGAGEERKPERGARFYYYLVLSAILFGLGVVAFVFKRNIITIFMSIELMLNAVNLAFVAFSRAHGTVARPGFCFFCDRGGGRRSRRGTGNRHLIARNRQSLNVERVNLLKTVKCRYSNICGSFRCCRCWARR